MTTKLTTYIRVTKDVAKRLQQAKLDLNLTSANAVINKLLPKPAKRKAVKK